MSAPFLFLDVYWKAVRRNCGSLSRLLPQMGPQALLKNRIEF